MKLKIIYSFLFCTCFTFFTLSQERECNDILTIDSTIIPPEAKAKSPCSSIDPSTPIKYLRINIHYLLKDDGTGNFNETGDMLDPPNPFSGYDYANYIIDYCNLLLANNVTLNHQPYPPVPAEQTKYRLFLNGIFFIRNTTKYDQSNPSLFNYIKNSGEAINLFLTPDKNGIIGGYTNALCGNRIQINGHDTRYILGIDVNNWWANQMLAETINHEVGHTLCRHHTITSSSGCNCCNTPSGQFFEPCVSGDGCDDTPTVDELIAAGFTDPCCWNCSDKSNNIMDCVSSARGLSPCQICNIHLVLDNSKLPYQKCHYNTDDIEITGFSDCQSYIAKTVSIPNNSSIVVSQNKGLFINAEEFLVNGELEIELGSTLIVNSMPNCN